MALNVLATPASICDAVKLISPCTAYEGDVSEDGIGFSMRLLLPGVDPIVISNAVDRELIPALVALVRDTLLYTSSQQCGERPRIDITRFSLSAPLSDWQSFQRIRYERGGHRCLDVLIAYLNGEDEENALQTLKQLGLAPEQMAHSCVDSDLAYFLNLIKLLDIKPREVGRRVFARLRERYAAIFPAIEQKLQERLRIEAHQAQEDNYLALLKRLNAAVLGQESAAKLLAATLVSSPRTGDNKVFLFVGPTGVGKTEMAKTAASIKRERFIMLSMNQYQSEHNVANLFGSPPAHVGSTDKPYFAKAVEQYASDTRRSEGSTQICEVQDVVILFDEFEKAHTTVKQSLLTLFDERYCKIQYTDGQMGGNIEIKYKFTNSIFIGTSNLYQEQIAMAFRAEVDPKEIAVQFKTLNRELPLPSSYSQELLGRMTVIPFGPIPKGACYQRLLQSKMSSLLPQLARSVGCRSVEVENQSRVLEILETLLYGEGIDIRRVKRYFEEDLKSFIYENRAQWGRLETHTLVLLPYEGDRLGIKVVASLHGGDILLYGPVPISDDPVPMSV